MSKRGFTLIELSIVLVIIALIVGGVLVGRDLINAAEIRNVIRQYEKYNAAVNTFRNKYGGIPGDLQWRTASSAGLFYCSGLALLGTPGWEDGNGLLDSGGSTSFYAERSIFWRHLGESNLIEGSFSVTSNNAISPISCSNTGPVSAANVKYSVPEIRLRGQLFFSVYNIADYNYYEISSIASIGNAYFNYGTSGLRPYEAYNLDAKTDDGMPNSGIAQANGGLGGTVANVDASWAAVSTANTCLTGGSSATDTTATYNLIPATGANDPSCLISFRFQ